MDSAWLGDAMVRKILRGNGMVTIAAGILLITWWGLMGSMMLSGSDDPLREMVGNSNWTMINLLGSLHVLLLTLAIVGLYVQVLKQAGRLGLIGFLLAFFGSILFAWIQIEEMLLWPLLASHAPVLVDMEGPMFADTAFIATYLLMGLFFIPGILIFGIALYRSGKLPRWGSLLFAIGGAMFGIGGLYIPFRTIGAVVFCAGLVWLGLGQWKHNTQIVGADR